MQHYKPWSPRPQEIPPDLGTPGQAAARGTAADRWDPDMTLLPCTASPARTATCPDTCHLPSSRGAGRRDETAPSGVCRAPAGMSQAPFPARQCQGEGTPRRESWATAGGDRRGWAGGRQGGRDGGSSRGGRGKDRQPAAWPHCPAGPPGVSPTASPAVSAPLQTPRGTPPPAFSHTRKNDCKGLHPGAGRGSILAEVAMATSIPSSPAHGILVRATTELPAGCSPSSRIIRSPVQPRRRRNAGAHMCELELMEMDRMLRLHRFTSVCSPRNGGWWFFISGWRTES